MRSQAIRGFELGLRIILNANRSHRALNLDHLPSSSVPGGASRPLFWPKRKSCQLARDAKLWEFVMSNCGELVEQSEQLLMLDCRLGVFTFFFNFVVQTRCNLITPSSSSSTSSPAPSWSGAPRLMFPHDGLRFQWAESGSPAKISMKSIRGVSPGVLQPDSAPRDGLRLSGNLGADNWLASLRLRTPLGCKRFLDMVEL